ncbi:hypothetical protein IS481_11995 [Caldimonas thermodepolymerans]|uniref:Uncharacterized protein n=1 Tax=Caldimonas thermodepolymerans TaxID=215580 RepID=A0A2S5T956_9BURK|nr:hypothetical protein [Caldimonas thermodepolymerans]PPE71462.1 hypothetical protein C1702_00210 [Caldimonas thermodepolymerans]QPC30491.1 hypothetical protein IS481_11995 [Caldimonas thermodepolymerans]RDI02925.1 hypothetical protein DES46_102353 [Caldimonas thermodepolymerans]
MKTRPSDPRRRLVTLAKYRAKKKGIPFGITYEDVYVPRYCPVLGIPLRSGVGVACDHSPTLDRIDPDKGYVRGNVVVISNRANRLKGDAGWRELVRIAAFYQQLDSS